MRWYEIRRDANGRYSLYQQGTYAPADGVHRWMGSIAQDKNGDMGLGYSVVNGTNVFPGIRYTGPAGRRPARADDARRRDDHQRLGCPDDDELALGRLHRS